MVMGMMLEMTMGVIDVDVDKVVGLFDLGRVAGQNVPKMTKEKKCCWKKPYGKLE